MKNSSRKNNSNKNSGNKKNKSPQNIGQAKELKEKKEKTAEAAGKEREVKYQVRTKRDSAVLMAYITFNYRVFHPAVTARLLFYGVLIALPGFFIRITGVKIACWVIGGLLILLGLFRQYISLALTRSNDPDHKAGTEFTYDFTETDAAFYRDGELISYADKYKDIISFFYDEDFYYLGIRNKDFFILPKSRFTIGDPAEFKEFIYQKSKKTCKWIPSSFREQMKKRRAARMMRAEADKQ